MPNWCENNVRLSHTDKNKIDALENAISDQTGIFASLRAEGSNPDDWYAYNVSNWGTKWDVTEPNFWEREDDNTITISMDTAWSPPTILYAYLVEQGWDVYAVYLEPAMGFGGVFDNINGDVFYEYDISNLDSIEALPEDVIDFGDLLYQHESWKEENAYEA